MNEPTKKDSIKTILIVVFALIAVGSLGFIAYDKLIKKENPITEENNKVEDNKQEDNKVEDNKQDDDNKIEENTGNLINDVKNFPQKSDDTIIYETAIRNLLINDKKVNLNENFKEIKNSINGINYIVSCSDYNPDYKKEELSSYNCIGAKIYFEKYNATIDFSLPQIGCSDESKIILTNDHLIYQELSGCGGAGKIIVYDKTGKEIFKEEKSVYSFGLEKNSEEYIETEIVVIDNVLYYTTATDSCEPILTLNSYNLITKTKKETQKINIDAVSGSTC